MDISEAAWSLANAFSNYIAFKRLGIEGELLQNAEAILSKKLENFDQLMDVERQSLDKEADI